VKLKDWPAHIEGFLKQRPELADAHIVRYVRCVGYLPLQLWDAEALPAQSVDGEGDQVKLREFEWEERQEP
jgi:hypothetical protein